MSLNNEHLDELRTRMLEYMDSYGLPQDRDTLAWFQEVAREDTTPEQAFEPLYNAYFSGSGGMFTDEQWMEWTTDIANMRLRPDRGGEGVRFDFDFDFDSGEGDYYGSRHGWGTV